MSEQSYSETENFFLRQECIWQMLIKAGFDADKLTQYGEWRNPSEKPGDEPVFIDYIFRETEDDEEEVPPVDVLTIPLDLGPINEPHVEPYLEPIGAERGICYAYWNREYSYWHLTDDTPVQCVRWMPLPDPLPDDIVAMARERLAQVHLKGVKKL